MKILLDECQPLISLKAFQIMRPTLLNRGLKGKKNGDLLRAAEITGYDVLLTVDQGIPHQQSFAGRTISIILVRSGPIRSKTYFLW